jgi:SAM-dependent methyltransferase
MIQNIKHTMSYNLSIQSDKGQLQVSWNNVVQLARYANLQAGFYLVNNPSLSTELLKEHFSNWNQMFWNQRQSQKMFDLPDSAKIVDIGSGVAVVDLLLYSYVQNSSFYLVDQEQEAIEHLGTSLPNTPYTIDYPTYNSWATIVDAIETSGFDRSRFNFLNPTDELPEDVDAVTSYLSWCFHYPKEVYWDKVMSSLKTGGKLVLDVRPLHNRNVIEEISEELKCKPVTFAFPILEKFVDTYEPVEKDASGYRCMWTKNI